MNNKALLSVLFLLVIFSFSCSSATVQISRPAESQKSSPAVSSNAPDWASKIHFVDNGTHYFTGRSGGEKDAGECHEKALRDALHEVSKYVKVELKSLSKSYEEMMTGEEAEMVTAVSTEKGAQITLKEYFNDYFNEPRYEGGSVVNDCFVKIAVSNAEMEKIKVQAANVTAWKMSISSQCSTDKDVMTALFKHTASANGWILSRESVENLQSGNSKFAFFAETSVSCNGDSVTVVTTRHDLMENSTLQTIFATGNDFEQLKKDYISSAGIYIPVVNYPEYPAVEKNGVFSKLNVELLKLYNEAFNSEKKGRLFPEKAVNSWTSLYNYSGDNPFKTLAKERMDFYKNMETAQKNTSLAHDADLKKLEQLILMTALPGEKIAESFGQYFETYGAFAGRKVTDQLIAGISPAEKKATVKAILFENDKTTEKWKNSCNSGNGASCYLYSFTNASDARDMKKKACLQSVKKACTELADDAFEAKQGESALYFGEKACHLGEKGWCFKAGSIVYSGKHGVKTDVVKSIPLLMDACEVNEVGGCAYLGFIFEKGEDGKKDPIRSKFFYDRACSLGHKESCNRTGE